MPTGPGYACSRMSSGLNADTALWALDHPNRKQSLAAEFIEVVGVRAPQHRAAFRSQRQ